MKSTGRLARLTKTLLLSVLLAGLASCEPPQVYGSVGYSSFNGGYGGGFGSSVRVGGRIY
jgi:hypothetical protein